DRTVVGDALNNFLADTYALYLQTQNFHWNVAGPHFHPLQLMCEEQYGQPAVAVDGIAERLEVWA
ncbi:MAG: DNA starvation/stationary phase protection protein, partial [Fuerstiella sp.]|nr:DNA starvation/stationary phase protection protein [Fuerstiella sp.]